MTSTWAMALDDAPPDDPLDELMCTRKARPMIMRRTPERPDAVVISMSELEPAVAAASVGGGGE